MNQAAPVIAGLTHQRRLGGGGFADVHLYVQDNVSRLVAVKVLRDPATSAELAEQFRSEGTLMAALSEHPHIVTIHFAGIADDGRPYLVMAYLPGRTLDERYKQETVPLDEVLVLGVQLAGAVETAHRHQILHRDVKPANVLTTRTGRPALTDFGISVSRSWTQDSGMTGLSIPWAPPEMVVHAPAGDERADIWSLGATLFTVLAGHTPFHRAGEGNTQADLIHRIMNTAPPPTGRRDVPVEVERILARSMARDPGQRYQRAIDLAAALQDAQRALGQPVTQLEVTITETGDQWADRLEQQDVHTRVRPRVIQAQQPGDSTRLRATRVREDGQAVGPAAPELEAPQHTVVRSAGPRPTPFDPGPVGAPRAVYPPAPSAPTLQGPPVVDRPRRRPGRVLVPVLLALALAAGVAVVLVNRGTEPPVLPDTAAPSSAIVVPLQAVPAPEELEGQLDGADVRFTWVNPDPQDDDQFRWRRTDVADVGLWQTTGDAEAVVTGVERACIEVELIRADARRSTTPSRSCYPSEG